ncbi:MAG: hypothetical protein WBX00_14580 [Isosphaeraceae bacterium]
MVLRRLYTWNVALLILLGLHAPAANAAPIEFTGNVPNDFNPATNPGVVVTPVSTNPLDIGQPAADTANGWVSGWAVQDIRTYYNSSNDTLYVGIDTFKNPNGQYAPFGQANGNPAGTPTGDDPANLGGDKSIAIAFAPVSSTNPTQPGIPLVIAGVPADKSQSGKGIDGFTVSKYNAATAADGLGYQFGQTLPQFTGNLAHNPTPAYPQLEFTITNFSQIPGLNPSNGFWIEMYAGSAMDQVGEAGLDWTKVSTTAAQEIPNTPEPTTWLAWSLLIGAAACRFRGRIRAQS